MADLLPAGQAKNIKTALTNYLKTTFALADSDAQSALEQFLEDPVDGIFKGPYIRTRLPFRPAAPGWEQILEWLPEGFVPYGHQAAAWQRLAGQGPDGSARIPQPILVTTGTGSGKTECFTYPILDQALRHRRAGRRGMTALILYPMNALANDQAARLATALTSDPRLAGLTAALYTGEANAKTTRVSETSLITDRAVIRDSPPDILLTNYKMLDALLLRTEDQPLWQESADSLTYLVLDEFHTYDGAQGTDVAMLLRRLGLTLAALRSEPTDGSLGPLGPITPVATSATLGDGGDPGEMLDFARTVFGRDLGADAVVTESRLTMDEWRSANTDIAETLLTLIENTTTATDIATLGSLLPGVETPVDQLVDQLSRRRLQHGRSQPSVETHLWIRELSRIDRIAATTAAFRWSDDGTIILAMADDATADDQRRAFPAIYCRHCGRSGWGVELAPTGADLRGDSHQIRRRHASGEGRFRALIHAPAEADHLVEDTDSQVEGLHWFDAEGHLAPDSAGGRPDRDDPDFRAGRILPVLALSGNEVEKKSRNDECPACQGKDGIRFLGSAIATMLSVTMSALFGDSTVASSEKKALVFTDSVQDAAHRAGFVEARSHTLTLRSAIRTTIGTDEFSLEGLAEEMIIHAGDDPYRRFALLAPDLADNPSFTPFWKSTTRRSVPVGVRRRMSTRLLFDLVLEFGLTTRVGRTLEQTGSVAAEVNAGPASRLAILGRAAISGVESEQTLDNPLDDLPDATLTMWVRGVLERMRTQGSIHHEWFDRYIRNDGARFHIWGGRPRNVGMPAFPHGRSAPQFPRIGPELRGAFTSELDPVTPPSSWYARWAAQVLDIPSAHGARLARALMSTLSKEQVITEHATVSQAAVYSIPASSVVVRPIRDADLSRGRHILVCTICRTEHTGTIQSINELDGAPCLLVRCPGTLTRQPREDNYYRGLYRSTDMRRVVAREHTSLLPDAQRLEYETEFKSANVNPSAPNVLVATPTLEMGIDIGDLSTVMLSSLPRTVASYLQRVGRAGRATGNALDLAFVTGRGEHLPRLGDPLSIINGAVRPPATYLSAEEILQRQYLAHLVDEGAREGESQPRKAEAAIGDSNDTSFLGRLITRAETNAEQRVERFLTRFEPLQPSAADALRTWAVPPHGPQSSGLAALVHRASRQWRKEREALQHTRKTLLEALPSLEQTANVPAASSEDKRAVQVARSTLIRTEKALTSSKKYWINVLEEHGLLPNYTLLDDGVQLDVTVSWLDPDSQEYSSDSESFARTRSRAALTEFVPGQTFYAMGMAIEIDAVDLGPDAQDVRSWAFCPACGYACEASTPEPVPSTCPRCGAGGLSDTRQRLNVVELKHVTAAMRRDEARITDRNDTRIRTPYTLVTAADIDPQHVARQWYVDGYDFGIKYVRQLTLRWLNLGISTGQGASYEIAGDQLQANLFRVCTGCGCRDLASRQNRADEHRPWCPYRKSNTEKVTTLAFSRTLDTQGVVIRLPWSVTLGDSYALPSLSTAVLLGLREQFGGSPDHLGVEVITDPTPGDSNNHDALLLHDTVPGGTGYLAELADPERVWHMLHRAWLRARDCPCRDEPRLACHRCLLPLAAPSQVDQVSREAAERHLRAILLADSGEPAPTTDMGWSITSTAADDNSWESHLELHFRQIFGDLLKANGAKIEEIPGSEGNRLVIHLGRRRWLLEPQVMMGGVQPDFVLSTDGAPSVMIFTDGHAYHASPAHNVIAQDAAKRAMLMSQGHVVLSITAQDVSAVADEQVPPPPAWYHPEAAATVRHQFPFTTATEQAFLGGPLTWLMGWMADPATTDRRALADALPLIMRPSSIMMTLPADTDLAVSAGQLIEGATLEGAAAGWWWQAGPLGMLARVRETWVEMAVVLDDRGGAIAHPDHRDAWHAWLQLMNAVQLRGQQPTVVTSLGAAVQTPTSAAPVRIDVVVPGWQDVVDLMITDDERRFVSDLAEHGVALPDQVGEEDPDTGIAIDLAWSHDHVAVIFEADEMDVDDLARAGWTVVTATVDDVSAALAGAPASDSESERNQP